MTTNKIALVTLALLSSTGASFAQTTVEGRPGIIREGTICFQPTDTYGDFRDQGREIPCDDRYKEAESIAGWKFRLKTQLKMDNSLINKASWETWQASAASGARTLHDRLEADDAEQRKQAERHADESKPFLQMCQPLREEGRIKEEGDTPHEWFCQFDKTRFQIDYWLALQGDHQAQENVAYCFREGVATSTIFSIRWPCYGVVRTDETAMSAWLLVAASSGHPESSKSAEKYG
jgi:hypothetical protein